ncbi:MAG: hypothetical protein K2K08_09160 [Paramuribaculum sp.]|nr:hypothetical protein [Paramuribaculum sp.]
MKNFSFAMKWHEILKPYSDDIRREVYDAVIEYAASGQIIDMQPLARMAFDFIRYEIDDKARRREARLAKKQQKDNQQNLSSAPQTSAVTQPTAPINPLKDPDKITDEFMATGKAPKPFTINKGSNQIIISKKRIRTLVKMTVQDILKRKPSLNHAGIMSELNSLVYSRFEYLRQDIMEQCPSKIFTEEIWQLFIECACDSVLA